MDGFFYIRPVPRYLPDIRKIISQMKYLLFLLFVGISLPFHAQQPKTGTMSDATAISDYFKADREGLHLHLNKVAFLAGEKIWFKGYVVRKQSRQPYGETTNAYVSLLDSKGQRVVNTLQFCENSLFSGYVDLPENLNPGVYYVQAYTNFMNNFTEDESSIYPITVMNPESTEFYDPNTIDYTSIDIMFAPESGVFLNGTSNTMAFRISDCSSNGISGIEAKIKDNKGVEIASAVTDAAGYSRFDISDTNMGPYTLFATIDGKPYEKRLPVPSATGVTFSTNNYIFPDKATVIVKTNAATLDKIKGKPMEFVIQSYQASTVAQFIFDGSQTRQTLSIPAAHFSDGLNTVYLLDANHSKIAERRVYQNYRKPSSDTKLEIVHKRGDSIILRGSSPLKLASLSISVLPVSAMKSRLDIFSKLELSALDNNPKVSGKQYFTDFSRKKQYELDNMLIAQNPKYSWPKITGSAPVLKYDFDKGLIVKGTVNNKAVDRSTHKINLNAMALGLNELTTLNEKNEFAFQNIIAEDSSTVFVSLLNNKNQRSQLQVASQVSGNNRQFIKAFEPVGKTCSLKPIQWTSGIPTLKNTIQLDSVTVSQVKKEKLSEQNRRVLGNNMAKGFKITDQDVNMYATIVDFIQNNGYNVTQVAGRVVITRTYSTSFQAQNSPAIFVDDMLQDDNGQLTMYRMDMIDEVYINRRGYGGGSMGSNGIIRIYTKKGVFNTSVKIMSKGLLIKGGFQKNIDYINPAYDDYHSDAFNALGAIHWIPDTATDSDGTFRFSIPNFHQESVKICIEGIASDGSLLSEEQIIEIK